MTTEIWQRSESELLADAAQVSHAAVLLVAVLTLAAMVLRLSQIWAGYA